MIFSRRLFSALICTSMLVTNAPAFAEAPEIISPRIYRLDCGNLKFDNMAPFADTGEFDNVPREMVGSCVLVGHSEGWLLWDAGLSKAIMEKPLHNEEFGVTLSMNTSIESQLQAIGLTPKDITYLTFSHTHFDHTGQANDFADATWIWQKAEKEFATKNPDTMVVDPATFSKYTSVKETIINGDHDVFGDGTVRLLATPGHTPGHQVLLVTLPSGKWLFSGDLYHQKDSRKKQLIPSFNVNRADTESSMHRIERIAKNYKASLFIQHEKNDIKKLPAFPDYLK